MKQKTGRKLLGVLLTLVMVIGLMPGMSLTAKAEDEDIWLSMMRLNDALNTAQDILGQDQNQAFFEGNRVLYETLSGKMHAAESAMFSENVDTIEAARTNLEEAVKAVQLAIDKQNAKAYLDNLLSGKTEADYETDDWTTLTKAITDGKAAIDEATTTAEIITAQDNAYNAVNAVKTKAEKASTYRVTITPGSNMTKTDASGAASQTGLSGAMTPVVYTANEGYYFPENYSVEAVNGISVTRNGYTQITVSGTPTGNAEITLTAPTAKTTPGAPTTVTATDCTTAANNDGKLTGITTTMEYKKSDAENWIAGTGSDITGLVPGTYYVRVKATDMALASDNQTLLVDSAWIAPTVAISPAGAGTVKSEKHPDPERANSWQLTAIPAAGYVFKEWTFTAMGSPQSASDNPYAVNKSYLNNGTIINLTAVFEATATPANIIKAPAAKSLTYNGSTQALVTAGEAEGGTMYYAVTTEDKAPTDENLYTTSIPEKTEAGTYYVWYKVKGDANHTDSTASAPVTVTISPVNKDALNAAISAAEAYYDEIKGNADYAAIAETLKKAIDAAKAVADDANVTAEQVGETVNSVTNAKKTAKDAVKAAEKKAADEAAAKAVTDAINALPGNAGVNDKAKVEAARKAYDALTEDQKKLVSGDELKKLTDAEASVQAAEEAAKKAAEEAAKKAADEAAAKAVTDAINALPGNAGVNDKAKVEAARKAYDALTEDQKKLVSGDELKKLTGAEASVQAAEEAAKKAAEEEAAKKADDEAAAKAVTDAINALPESAGIGDKAAVEAARAAYDALTEDQKKLIPEDALAKLIVAEKQIREAEEAAKTIDIAKCKISVKNQTYTGKVLKPAVTVEYGEVTLKKGTDYTVSYKNNRKIGRATVTVKGMGHYTGSRKLTFKICPKGTTFTTAKGGKQQIALKWKNPKNVTGYVLQYSLKKNFSGKKTVVIRKAGTLGRIIGNLKANKTYYVRIRTYTKVNKKIYRSAWSRVVAVRTKAGNANNVPDGQAVEATAEGEDMTLIPDGELDEGLLSEDIVVLLEALPEEDIPLTLAD